MWLILIYYFLLQSTLAESQAPQAQEDGVPTGRVLNGIPIIPHSHPYIVQIFYNKKVTGDWLRQGVLLDPYTILTSGFNGSDYSKVIAGQHDRKVFEGTEQERKVCKVILNPDYTAVHDSVRNSYELIFVSDPFVFNQYVSAVNLPPKDYKPSGQCSLIGWGASAILNSTASNVLLERLVAFQDSDKCKAHPSQGCLTEGPCSFDFGAPVMCTDNAKTQVYGLVASRDNNMDCGGVNSLSITSYLTTLPWFQSALAEGAKACGGK